MDVVPAAHDRAGAKKEWTKRHDFSSPSSLCLCVRVRWTSSRARRWLSEMRSSHQTVFAVAQGTLWELHWTFATVTDFT
jgi:hypothetical protein